MSAWEWLAVVGIGVLLMFLVINLTILIYALERVRDVGVALCERADAWVDLIEKRSEP